MTDLAVRIHEPGTLDFDRRIQEWVKAHPDIQCAAGCLETGELNGRLHWQLAITFNGSSDKFRRHLLVDFPELKGDRKGGLYSVGNCRKSWETNVCYCMKSLDIRKDRNCVKILKNITVDDIISFRTNCIVLAEKPTKRQSARPWNIQLAMECNRVNATTDEEMVWAILEYYFKKAKTVPEERYQMPKILATVKVLMQPEDNRKLDNLANKYIMYI